MIPLGILAASATSTFTFLLDQYPNAGAAFSLRKLRSAYAGSAIRVRRSSDNTELDIGFVNNILDTTTLTTFVGAGNGFVSIWYDQSGNGRNMSATTTALQPSIITSGSIITSNNKPAIYFNETGTNLYFFLNSGAGYAGTTYIFNVIKTSDTNFILYHAADSGAFIINVGTQGSADSGVNYNATIDSYYKNNILQTNPTTRGAVYNIVSTNSQILLSIKTLISNWGRFSISGYTSFQFDNYNQEIVLYYSTSQNITGINSNINSYYSIY